MESSLLWLPLDDAGALKLEDGLAGTLAVRPGEHQLGQPRAGHPVLHRPVHVPVGMAGDGDRLSQFFTTERCP